VEPVTTKKTGQIPKSLISRKTKTTIMKKILVTSLLIIFASALCFSQDLITKKTGEDIQAKILEVGQTEVKYKKSDNLTGPTFSISKSDVIMIRYENGTKDVFVEENKKAANLPAFSVENYLRQGQMDAKRYYKGYKPAATGTLVSSLLIPIVGLVPAIICSTNEPDEINLNYPNPELMKNPEYATGYTQQAHKIKSRKVWTNFGIGFGVNVAALVILSAASQ